MITKFALGVLAALLFIFSAIDAKAAVTCTLSASGVAFGTFSGSDLLASGEIVINCSGTGKTNYTIALSKGSSSTYNPRRMTNGANTLSYNLYREAALSSIWGDGTLGSLTLPGKIDMKGKPTITIPVSVYGKVPAQVRPAPGAYSDPIVATMDYGPTTTTSFQVTANAPATCAISAHDLPFGSYTQAQLDGQSAISVNCASSTAWNVGLNPGTFAGATVTTRRMRGPTGAALSYSLYRNAARTLNWGNTVGTDTVSGTGTGSPQIINVYGRIPAAQSDPAGGYRDTITATLTF